jgi:hypothetical protein
MRERERDRERERNIKKSSIAIDWKMRDGGISVIYD